MLELHLTAAAAAAAVEFLQSAKSDTHWKVHTLRHAAMSGSQRAGLQMPRHTLRFCGSVSVGSFSTGLKEWTLSLSVFFIYILQQFLLRKSESLLKIVLSTQKPFKSQL